MAIEAEPETCALLMVVMMLNLPRVGSFACAPARSLAGRPTLAHQLIAAGCSALPRSGARRVAQHLRMGAEDAAAANADGLPAYVHTDVANFWVLAEKEGPPEARHVRLCGQVIQAQKARQGQLEALEALAASPVAIELTSSLDSHRPFRLPGAGGAVAQVRETSFGGSGLGYACVGVCVGECGCVCVGVCVCARACVTVVAAAGMRYGMLARGLPSGSL